ncbi:MAG: tetratricopeptide repeat protein [Candidatus Subteraquimicrobiales bacterium]|nr:tetratricopeptide repeat protein [Candidatus Subteraquimicrobiales bacterium]
MKRRKISIIILNLFLLVVFMPSSVVSEEIDKETVIKRHVEEGNRYLREGNYRDALKEWEKGLEIDSGNSSLNALITITKVQMKEEKEIQINIGIKYFFSEPGKAIKAWETVLRIDPDDADARENVKRLREEIDRRIKVLIPEVEERLQRKEFLYAKDSAMEILKLDPGSQQGKELVDRIKEAYIENLREKLKGAQNHYYAGKYNKAIENLEDLVKEKLLDPIEDTPTAYMFLGYCYGTTGEEEKAIESFRNALRFSPQIEVSSDVPLKIKNIFYKARMEEKRR